tara:strand:+ start:997 stop:1395 length:399 start_codon:yes stop_codon:yes gene_type:complete
MAITIIEENEKKFIDFDESDFVHKKEFGNMRLGYFPPHGFFINHPDCNDDFEEIKTELSFKELGGKKLMTWRYFLTVEERLNLNKFMKECVKFNYFNSEFPSKYMRLLDSTQHINVEQNNLTIEELSESLKR